MKHTAPSRACISRYVLYGHVCAEKSPARRPALHGLVPFQSRVVSDPTKPRWMDVAMSRVPPAMCTELRGRPSESRGVDCQFSEKELAIKEERSATETLNDDAITHGHQQVADFASERPEAKAMSTTSDGTCKRAAGPTDARH